MKRNRLTTISIAAMLAASTAVAFAQASLQTADAEVRKVDKDAGKITLKHGEIKNLDMPPMTMVFHAKDPALLDKIKAGDKVRFTADKVDGAYTVLSIDEGQ
jgi:Cu(I)/Ag(I) efflux system protein CusF